MKPKKFSTHYTLNLESERVAYASNLHRNYERNQNLHPGVIEVLNHLQKKTPYGVDNRELWQWKQDWRHHLIANILYTNSKLNNWKPIPLSNQHILTILQLTSTCSAYRLIERLRTYKLVIQHHPGPPTPNSYTIPERYR